MSTLSAAQAIAELPGPPQNPSIFSQMTVILQGGLQFDDNNVNVRGPVAELQRMEQPQSQNQSAEHRVTTLKFDDQERLIKQTYQDNLAATEMINVFGDGRLQSQTVDHRSANNDWQDWQQWSYDEHGRISEFRAGRNNAEWNHYSNFKYDAQGRSLGYEYRDSKFGGPPTFTDVAYSGKTVTLSRLDANGRKFFEQVQILDDKGWVIDLRVSDLSDAQLKQWYHVMFKYDEKNRVIEQSTDPFKLGSGDDYSPIPGKLVVEYNDAKHSGEQNFFDTDGKLLLHTIFGFDHDGALTWLRVVDAFGKEQMGSDPFLDPQSHKVRDRPGRVEWDVTYDDHGNWIERRRFFTPADGSPRILTRFIRQNITYR